MNIFVYNEKYIDKNIRLKSDGLDTIILFGEQVDLDKQIETLEAEIKKCKEITESLDDEYKKYNDSSNLLSPNYFLESIKEKLRKDGWAEIDSKIKGNRQNTAVSNNIVHEIMRINPSKPKDKLLNEFNEKFSLFKNITEGEKIVDEIELIKIDREIDTKVLRLLSKKIEEPILTEREKKILDAVQNGLQNQIETSKDIFSKKETKECPYCFRPIDEKYKASLIKSIEKVLNKDVDKHKEELRKNFLKKIDFDIMKYSKLNSNLCEEIRKKVEICNDIIEKYNSKIEEKYSNIYNSLKFTDLKLVEHILELNKNLEELEELRNNFNDFIDNKEKLKQELLDLNKQIAFYNIKNEYNEYLKQKNKKESLEKNIKEIKENLDSKVEFLEELKQRKKSIKIALDYINKALEYVFFSKERFILEPKNNTYYLKSFGKSVKPGDISTGERNIIALCYFFTEILNNKTKKDAYKDKYFLIIDDPISSFDLENKIGIHSFLKSQIQKIILGNKDSKVVILSHDLATIYDFAKAAGEIRKVAKKYFNDRDYTKFKILELKNKSIDELSYNRHEYTKLLEMVYNYAIEDNINNNVELVIGNVMRRVLEAFSTFEYKKGIEEISYDRKILSLLNNQQYENYFEHLMYRLVLNGESHFEEKIKALHDMEFYSYISPEEKIRTAKDILCFLYLLNPKHIECHLSEVSGAVQKIEEWCQNILSDTKQVG